MTAFPSSWARASSLAAQSSPFSRAQERKVALKPCRVVSSPAVRKASAIVLWWMIPASARREYEIIGCGQRSRFFEYHKGCLSRVGRGAGDASSFARLAPSTVRCRRSISVHRAPRVSLERVAVRMANRMATAAGVSSASRAARVAGCFVGRCGGEVPDRWFPPGQNAVEDFACGIGLEISLGDDPGADQAETLPEASGEFGVRVPARLKHAQDVSAAEPVDLDVHNGTAVIS